MTRSKSNKNAALFLILMGWLVYTVSCMLKLSYAANITQILDHYNITKADAGLVSSLFALTYGIGQFVNGFLCKKYNIKWMLFASLFISGLINFFIAISPSFEPIKYLWLINGFVMSVLWPTLVRMLSESLPQRDLSKSSVIMGTTTATGTLIVYGLSSYFATMSNFKLAFYTTSIASIAAAFICILGYNRFVSRARKVREEEGYIKIPDDPVKDPKHTGIEKHIFHISIGVICFYAICSNLIKDGITTWVPSILKEEFSMTDSLAILLTLFMPMISIFGNAFALTVHKRIPDYTTHCFTFFMLMAVFITIIIGSLSLKSVFLVLAGLTVSCFFASSLNSLLTSIFPMFMRGKIDSGKFAGILNGCCYFGSVISSYGLGYIAEHFGWTMVFIFLIAFCILSGIIWTGFNITKHYLRRRF